MGNINSSFFINGNTTIPGCRLNDLLIDYDKLKQSTDNVLWKEYVEAEARLRKILEMSARDEVIGDLKIVKVVK
jgi:hypothetical protein